MYATYPIYNPSWYYAKENGELDLWKESHKINKDCRDFINEKAGNAYHDRLLPEFIKELTETFGLERSVFVTARFVVTADWDGRYGSDVKERAALVDFQDITDTATRRDAGEHIKMSTVDRTQDLYSNVHPCILNDIFRSLMKIEKEQINIPSAEAEQDNEQGVEQ